MIRYPITEDELWNRIETLQPNWRARTQTRLQDFVAAGKYLESSSIWSEVKRLYTALQHQKCGYCEKWLESEEYGLIEHDVEHYRPKGRVRAYPPTSGEPGARDRRTELEYDFATGGDWPTGYFRLAYHPLNYLTACKTCNSTLKSDYFPVAAARIDGATHPRGLAAEEPFLLYPISDLDVAPETLIGFEGIFAVPVGTTPAERWRAQVTIDFFQLNNREDLRRQRAEIIHTLFLFLSKLPDHVGMDWAREVTRRINAQVSSRARHANCSRCFVRLFQSDPDRARSLALEAGRLHNFAGDDGLDGAGGS